MKRVFAIGFLLAAITSAAAQPYPSHPVTMVVPFGAGGPTDALARILAQRMSAPLGQTVLVENVTGASGTIGITRVARAAPDGYTIVLGNWPSFVVASAIYPHLPYDVQKDFEPISLLTSNSYVIVAKLAVPANDLQGFIAWLKAHPDMAYEGTAGPGSPQHVSGVFFQNATGTRFQFVPYRGAAPAIQDLLAGHIDMIIDDPTNCLPHVRAGKIKAFAVTAPRRLAAAPDIPTVDEAGLPNFYFSRWHALWAPKGTPHDVIAKLDAAVVAALDDPAVRSRLAELGQDVFPREQRTPAALAAWHKAEIEKWWPVIRAAGIKSE